ncbi:methionyl-tRNA formyltransferase [Anaerolentibacter hominis]|uniref:methionyl-tRNA formyltransferase n=1 Tax=Anaerolentibacter hominis TaxID=3079009 RepID=UPI0031B87A8D
MRIVFMGTPDFSVPTLVKLKEAGHEIAAVVTQPDKPKGRGKTMQAPPVKEKALELSIPVFQPVKVREPEFIAHLKKLNPDVIVVVAFGQILPESILTLPEYGCINVHASLLPKLRGAAPIQWAVINGDREAGVTIMHMDVGLDTGDMITQESIPVEPEETGGSLHDKLSVLGAELLVKTLPLIESGTAPRVPQKDADSTYVKILNKAMGQIDFTKRAEEIERLIRGLNPWPSAYTFLNGKTLKIWKAQAVPEKTDGRPGEILTVGKECITVQTGAGNLRILELQLEGKKRMSTESFLRGYEVSEHTILG